jgi:hypothetical protein
MTIAEQILKEIKPGDLLLSFNKEALVSKAISEVTGSDFSHVFTYIGMGKILNAQSNGYVINKLSHYLNYDKYYLSLRRPFEDKPRAKKFIEESKKLRGVDYGFLQLFYIGLLHLLRLRRNKRVQVDLPGMTCSETVANAMYNMHMYPFDADLKPSHVEPGHIADCELIRKIV